MVDASLLRAKVEVQGARQASSELRDFGNQINQAGAKSSQAASGLSKAEGSIGRAGAQAGTATTRFGGLSKSIAGISPVTIAATAAVTGLAAGTKASIDASLSWESALAGVAKTLDTTGLSADQSAAEVARIGGEIRDLAKETPIAADELAGVAEAAGQLGVSRQNVVGFTEVMAQLGATTDLTAEQAATFTARFTNITGTAPEDVDNFASALVDLGNNSAATEGEILAMGTRIAAAGNMAGLSEGEILGLSAALTSVGINAEAGGTALVQVMSEITKSVETADDRLGTFAEVAGQSAEEFAASWRANPSAAITDFVEGLGNLSASGGSTVQVLDELNLDGIRVSQALNSAAGAGDLMRDSMDRGNRAFADGTAAQKEFAVRVETSASQLQISKNKIHDAAITIGDELTPALVVGADKLADFTVATVDFVTWLNNVDLTARVADWVTGIDSLHDPADRLLSRTEEIQAAMETITGQSIIDIQAWEQQQGISFMNAEAVFQHFTGRGEESFLKYQEILDGAAESTTSMRDAVTLGRESFHNYQAAAQDARDSIGQSFDELNSIFRENGDVASEYIDDLVIAADDGVVNFEDAIRAMAGVPEDVLYPALEDLRTKVQGELAKALLFGKDTSEAEGRLATISQIMADVGYSASTSATQILQMNDAANNVASAIESAQGAMSHWQGQLSDTEQAIKIVKDRIEESGDPTGEWADKLDELTKIQGRQAGAIHDDYEPALVDLAIAQGEVTLTQDELNQRLKDGKISPEEYAQAMSDLATETANAGDPAKELAGIQKEVAQSFLDVIDRVEDVLTKLDILDNADAEPTITFDETPTKEKIQDLEDNITNFPDGKEIEFTLPNYATTTEDIQFIEDNITAFPEPPDIVFVADTADANSAIDAVQGNAIGFTEGSPYSASISADGTAAEIEINRIKGLITSGATMPISVVSGSLAPTGQAFAEGGISQGGVAVVGEKGPELVVLPKGAQVIPADDSRRFLGGFADGTGLSQGVLGSPGIDTSGFTATGEQIGAAIALGINLELIDSGTPTGEEYAKAIVDGAVKTIEVEGADGVTDAWVVATERIPELASNLGGDTVTALLQQYADLKGQLQLAILSGDDTGEIQAELDGIFAIFAQWSGNSVGEVQAVWDAITDEAQAQQAMDIWSEIVGAIQMPSAPVSVSLDDIISGDAQAQIRADFQDLWNLQQIAIDNGDTEWAAQLGEDMRKLGLQEAFINSIVGSDTGQQLKDQFTQELQDAHLQDAFSGLFDAFSLEDIASGSALQDVQQQFQDLWDLQQVAQNLGYDEFAAELGQRMADLGLQEEFINSVLGTDAGAQLADEFAQQTADALAGQNFEEIMTGVLGDDPFGFEQSIQDETTRLQSLIDGGILEGLPTAIIEGWQSQLADVQAQGEQYWQTLADSLANGLVDPSVLQGFDEAGLATLQTYLEPIVGPEGTQQILDAREAIVQPLGAGTIAELAGIFSDSPDIAGQFIDDLVEQVNTGAVSFSEAMGLLGNIPDEQLGPALESLQDKLNTDLAAALLNGTDPSGIEANLQIISQLLNGVEYDADSAAAAIARVHGTNSVVGVAGAGSSAYRNLPGFAAGGVSPGGLALVGEQGPELAYLPAGTEIMPNRQTMGFLGGFAEGTSGFSTSDLATEIADKLGARLINVLNQSGKQNTFQIMLDRRVIEEIVVQTNGSIARRTF